MVLFWRTESYYSEVARSCSSARPDRPAGAEEPGDRADNDRQPAQRAGAERRALARDSVVALAVAGDEDEADRIKQAWAEWACNVPLEVLLDPHRSLVRSVLRYVDSVKEKDTTITVLIPQIIPNKRRHEVLHNQRAACSKPC